MAQEFLPSYRKWLDYEARYWVENSAFYSYMPIVNASVDTGAFFGDYK
jgi:hypothetical protein